MLNHKGYTGHVEFDDEAGIFHGEVLDLNDVVTFQGRTVEELERAFRESVEDYLAFLPRARRSTRQTLFWPPNAPFAAAVAPRYLRAGEARGQESESMDCGPIDNG